MKNDLKELVKETYTKAITTDSGCCEPSCCSPSTDVGFNESYSGIEGYNKESDYGLGCGIPTEFAKIQEGHVVLDLGSGAGNDVFVARSLVGTSGHVIGVDFTEAMIDKANENKAKLGFTNIDFRLGDIEDLPVKNDTIDVALSNCVMNLVPNKTLAYSEVYRVLKKSGHFSISDVVLSGELPKGILNAAEMYAGCVAGALDKYDYLQAIKDVGFKNIQVVKEKQLDLPDEILLQHISPALLKEYRNSETAVMSITVYGEK